MCGIAGFYSFQGNINRERFETMVDIIEYRGPDDRGVFYYNNLALGHRRLSIIDLSEDGHQPFGYKDRYVVVYNGEIYNYEDLKKKLILEKRRTQRCWQRHMIAMEKSVCIISMVCGHLLYWIRKKINCIAQETVLG